MGEEEIFFVLLIYPGLKEIINLLKLQLKSWRIRGLASRAGDNRAAGSCPWSKTQSSQMIHEIHHDFHL